MNTNPQIHIVWLKRDLRLEDNEAIVNALNSEKRVLLIYLFEYLLLNDPHYSQRHWDFIKQSLLDLNEQLEPYNSKVLIIKSDIIAAINQLLTRFQIKDIYSHQETGILVTYNRDKSFKRFCRNNLITWHESINNGVIRGLEDREHWLEKSNDYLETQPLPFYPQKNQLLSIEEINAIEMLFVKMTLNTNMTSPFQKGGRRMALKYLNSFLEKRYENYVFHISKPELSRSSCSRLSPYLSWGNLSIREVYHCAQQQKKTIKKQKIYRCFYVAITLAIPFCSKI